MNPDKTIIPPLTDGVAAIAEERQQQTLLYPPEHDDTHLMAELLRASRCYSQVAQLQIRTGQTLPDCFKHTGPFEPSSFKPDRVNPIPNLRKAGALIAAEIDRLLRGGGEL